MDCLEMELDDDSGTEFYSFESSAKSSDNEDSNELSSSKHLDLAAVSKKMIQAQDLNPEQSKCNSNSASIGEKPVKVPLKTSSKGLAQLYDNLAMKKAVSHLLPPHKRLLPENVLDAGQDTISQGKLAAYKEKYKAVFAISHEDVKECTDLSGDKSTKKVKPKANKPSLLSPCHRAKETNFDFLKFEADLYSDVSKIELESNTNESPLVLGSPKQNRSNLSDDVDVGDSKKEQEREPNISLQTNKSYDQSTSELESYDKPTINKSDFLECLSSSNSNGSQSEEDRTYQLDTYPQNCYIFENEFNCISNDSQKEQNPKNPTPFSLDCPKPIQDEPLKSNKYDDESADDLEPKTHQLPECESNFNLIESELKIKPQPYQLTTVGIYSDSLEKSRHTSLNELQDMDNSQKEQDTNNYFGVPWGFRKLNYYDSNDCAIPFVSDKQEKGKKFSNNKLNYFWSDNDCDSFKIKSIDKNHFITPWGLRNTCCFDMPDLPRKDKPRNHGDSERDNDFVEPKNKANPKALFTSPLGSFNDGWSDGWDDPCLDDQKVEEAANLYQLTPPTSPYDSPNYIYSSISKEKNESDSNICVQEEEIDPNEFPFDMSSIGSPRQYLSDNTNSDISEMESETFYIMPSQSPLSKLNENSDNVENENFKSNEEIELDLLEYEENHLEEWKKSQYPQNRDKAILVVEEDEVVNPNSKCTVMEKNKAFFTGIWINSQEKCKSSPSRRTFVSALKSCFKNKDIVDWPVLNQEDQKVNDKKKEKSSLGKKYTSGYVSDPETKNSYVSPFEDFTQHFNYSKYIKDPNLIILPLGFSGHQLARYRNPNHWHIRPSTLKDVHP